MSNKSVVIYSGGMDSYTLLADRKRLGDAVHAVSFDYGQRHVKELAVASKVCRDWAIPHQVVDLKSLQTLIGNSALTGDTAVPEGHYADENMKLTVVPNRNMIMLSIACGYAVNIGADILYAGVHAGDHAIYPDCRPEFIHLMDDVCRIANYQKVEVKAPFLFMSKADILNAGRKIPNVDYANTWTCYQGRKIPCGKCGSCVERLEAFDQAGMTDPLTYEDREFYKTAGK